jgi:hypothetical protein
MCPGRTILVVPETDSAELIRMSWLDRRRDLAGWLLTPLVALVAAPVTAAVAGIFFVVFGLDDRKAPALCQSALADNRCEETTLAMWGQHTVFFAGVWLLLWLVPWWRGLRVLRILLAIIAAGVLVAVPIRMVG